MAEYNCPHCKKPIYDDEAILCFYCGEGLNRNLGFMSRVKYFNPRVVIMVIAIIVLVSFVIVMLR